MVGTFELKSSNNFENYLAEMGVNYFLRQLAMLAQPVVTFSRLCPEEKVSSNCGWTILTDAGLKTHTISFSLEERVKDITLDGREVVSIFLKGGPGVLIEEQLGAGVNTTLVRTFHTDRMEVFMTVNHVEASSVFTRVDTD